jgi:hypothetical protein
LRIQDRVTPYLAVRLAFGEALLASKSVEPVGGLILKSRPFTIGRTALADGAVL